MSDDTIPNVFIIESLRFSDENHERFEGRILRQILKLSTGKESIYFYIRTRRELKAVLDRFTRSRFRYLHISCHGAPTCMSTTLENVPCGELGRILRPHLAHRRLFTSSCEIASSRLD